MQDGEEAGGGGDGGGTVEELITATRKLRSKEEIKKHKNKLRSARRSRNRNYIIKKELSNNKAKLAYVSVQPFYKLFVAATCIQDSSKLQRCNAVINKLKELYEVNYQGNALNTYYIKAANTIVFRYIKQNAVDIKTTLITGLQGSNLPINKSEAPRKKEQTMKRTAKKPEKECEAPKTIRPKPTSPTAISISRPSVINITNVSVVGNFTERAEPYMSVGTANSCLSPYEPRDVVQRQQSRMEPNLMQQPPVMQRHRMPQNLMQQPSVMQQPPMQQDFMQQPPMQLDFMQQPPIMQRDHMQHPPISIMQQPCIQQDFMQQPPKKLPRKSLTQGLPGFDKTCNVVSLSSSSRQLTITDNHVNRDFLQYSSEYHIQPSTVAQQRVIHIADEFIVSRAPEQSPPISTQRIMPSLKRGPVYDVDGRRTIPEPEVRADLQRKRVNKSSNSRPTPIEPAMIVSDEHYVCWFDRNNTDLFCYRRLLKTPKSAGMRHMPYKSFKVHETDEEESPVVRVTFETCFEDADENLKNMFIQEMKERSVANTLPSPTNVKPVWDSIYEDIYIMRGICNMPHADVTKRITKTVIWKYPYYMLTNWTIFLKTPTRLH